MNFKLKCEFGTFEKNLLKVSSHDLNWNKIKLGTVEITFLNVKKTFRWYLLGNRRLKSSLADIKYTFIFKLYSGPPDRKDSTSYNYYHIP